MAADTARGSGNRPDRFAAIRDVFGRRQEEAAEAELLEGQADVADTERQTAQAGRQVRKGLASGLTVGAFAAWAVVFGLAAAVILIFVSIGEEVLGVVESLGSSS